MLLGFQFHPEFFGPENPSKKKLSEQLYDWVTGKLDIVPGQSSNKNLRVGDDRKKPEVYTNFPGQEARVASFASWANTAVEEDTGASHYTVSIDDVYRGTLPNLGRVQFTTDDSEEEANG
jgi:hypothetical protein